MDDTPDHNKAADLLSEAFRDWVEAGVTPRKIIARRRANGRAMAGERQAMSIARALQDEGLVSILTRIEQGPGRARIITYTMERVQ